LKPDEDAAVLDSALTGLSHLTDQDAIPSIVPFSTHPDLKVRHAVVLALSGYESPLAVECLIRLSNDSDELVPELAPMIQEWIEGLSENQVLFPKLDKRRTWLMVKKDLERVGIPYETRDGIADFHAAGRHSFITQRVKNGATLPEAMKLARHSTVTMTMNYAHAERRDQTKALAKLSLPMTSEGTGEKQSVSDLAVFGNQTVANCVDDPLSVVRQRSIETPCWNGCSGNKKGRLSQNDKTADFMEAAGIEPASCEPWNGAATCVVDCFRSSLSSRQTTNPSTARQPLFSHQA